MTLARKPAATSELPVRDRAGPLPLLPSGASACLSAASFFAYAMHTRGHLSDVSSVTAQQHGVMQSASRSLTEQLRELAHAVAGVTKTCSRLPFCTLPPVQASHAQLLPCPACQHRRRPLAVQRLQAADCLRLQMVTPQAQRLTWTQVTPHQLRQLLLVLPHLWQCWLCRPVLVLLLLRPAAAASQHSAASAALPAAVAAGPALPGTLPARSARLPRQTWLPAAGAGRRLGRMRRVPPQMALAAHPLVRPGIQGGAAPAAAARHPRRASRSVALV